jgi:hypothetical protein
MHKKHLREREEQHQRLLLAIKWDHRMAKVPLEAQSKIRSLLLKQLRAQILKRSDPNIFIHIYLIKYKLFRFLDK